MSNKFHYALCNNKKVELKDEFDRFIVVDNVDKLAFFLDAI